MQSRSSVRALEPSDDVYNANGTLVNRSCFPGPFTDFVECLCVEGTKSSTLAEIL